MKFRAIPANDVGQSVWPRAIWIGVGYFVAASSMILLTRFDGGLANMWIATALLIAELCTADRARRRATIAACLIASVVATSLFGFGLVLAVPLAFVNVGEALIAATLLRRLRRANSFLQSSDGIIAFALVEGLAAPAIAGLPGAAIAAWSVDRPFGTEFRSWLLGHGLGTLTFTPVMVLLLRGEFARWLRSATPANRAEAAILMAVMAGFSWLVFTVSTVPLLFLPILPLMVITFRLEQVGSAVAVVILAMVGAVLTTSGQGPVNLVDGSAADHARLFQFYMAITVLTVLPVAAELAQRRDVFRRLHESEARYKLITESSTDLIVTLDRSGVITYASPSAREVTGFDGAEMIGHMPQNLACGPDPGTMRAAVNHAHGRAGSPTTVEYCARAASGESRWYEAHTRGTFDDNGELSGWVSAIRDVSVRKALELKLAHAASTDPLTGLANRRRFDTLLDRKIDDRRQNKSYGCIALFDIDYFKRVNDAHGHSVGDLVLETFAAAAQRTVRANDHVARLGGEEFGLILEGTTIEEATQICDRVRRAIAGDVTRAPSGAEVTVTVSAGIAEITPTSSRLQLMRAADEALYRAKAGGRDRLALAA
ncbi:sensor domain-containing diguanylate cyclase [Sphingomonas aquatica]|uniref:sensor domain-containing diguanylate cyclase n=1 Tax=Sphingomonas aquatica TaxID=1763824 RepID=UPI00301BE26E